MRIFLFMLIIFLPEFSKAQLAFGMNVNYYHNSYSFSRDTTKADTLPRKKMAPPKKAAIMSACLPGLGQIYNHKWWKVPIIYAGFGGLTYGFIWNQSFVADYRDALRMRYDDDPTTNDQFPNYTDNDLVTLKNYYERYRDLCVIGSAALYTLQVVDAAVDAHLATFDVSDDLSMSISPGVIYAGGARTPGIGIRLFYR